MMLCIRPENQTVHCRSVKETTHSRETKFWSRVRMAAGSLRPASCEMPYMGTAEVLTLGLEPIAF